MKKYIFLILSMTIAMIGIYFYPEMSEEVAVHKNIQMYYDNKTALIVEVQDYIDRVAPTSKLDAKVLVDACLNYDMDIVFVLSQGEIESHFGTKGRAAKTNSVFNVGAPDNATAKTSKKYATANDSVEPYVRLLANNYRTNGRTEEDLKRNFVNKKGQRYASEPDYERMLTSKCRSIEDSTNIKDLQKEIKKNTLKIVQILG